MLYTDQDRNPERVIEFGKKMKAARILINMPSSQGGIGDLYNFNVAPSLTLGCGSWGGNSISENVGPKHLINKKIVAKRQENMLWHKIPKSVYFRRGCLAEAVKELANKQRALIVTDKFLHISGHADELVRLLRAENIDVDIFSDVDADPTLRDVRKGVERAKSFNPDVIVGLRRRLPDGRGQDHVGDVRAPGRELQGSRLALHGLSASASTSSPSSAKRRNSSPSRRLQAPVPKRRRLRW